MTTASISRSKNLFREAKKNSVRLVFTAAFLLGMASLSLLATSLWSTHRAYVIGQILFVIFVFAAVTVLVITAIAQDIRYRRKDGY